MKKPAPVMRRLSDVLGVWPFTLPTLLCATFVVIATFSSDKRFGIGYFLVLAAAGLVIVITVGRRRHRNGLAVQLIEKGGILRGCRSMNRAEFEREVAPGFREVMERLRLDPFRFLFDPEHFGNAIDEYADESIRVRAVLDRSFVTIESSEPVRQRWMTMSAWQAFLDRSSRMTELSLDAQLDFLLRNFQIIVEAYKAENLAGHVGAVEEWSQLLRFD